MLTLDATTASLEVVLSGAITTNQLPIVSCFADKTTTTFTPGKTTTATNSTSTVTIVAAPAASTQREVHSINIYNADTVAATITVRENDNATLRILVKITLAVGDTLFYTHANGWRVTDSTGAEKTNSSLTLTGDVTGSGSSSIATTLATVNANVGSFGSTTQVATFTVNGKGLITAAANVSIAFPVTSVSGTTNQVTVSPTTGAVVVSLAGPHNYTTETNHGILLGQGTAAIIATAVMTDGQLLVGQSAADPLPKTISGDLTLTAAGVAATQTYGGWSSINNTSQNNSSTPNTQFDLTADVVTLRNSSNQTVTRFNPGTITNNVSTAGSTANGRDQAGAFSASSWIHFYWIWNGTTLATLSSTVAPPTGPTLPSGYTHWAYCGAVRFNASSILLLVRIKGNTVYYEIEDNGANRILNAGVATTFTAIDLSTLVPPNALLVSLKILLFLTHVTPGVNFTAYYRPTGSTLATGNTLAFVTSQVASVTVSNGFLQYNLPLGTSSQIDYRISSAPSVNGGVYAEVGGYIMPNGGY